MASFTSTGANQREQPNELIEVDGREAAASLKANWRQYAAEYDRVHGN
jgi:hypothetical protein